MKAKPSTAYPYYRALRRLFNWAIQEGYVAVSPLSTVHFKPPASPRIQGYSREELQRLLAVCDMDVRTGAQFTGTRNKAMLMLFIDSALRRAELVNLKLTDLNLDTRIINVIGKGSKPGIVPFSPATAKALWKWLLIRKTRTNAGRVAVRGSWVKLSPSWPTIDLTISLDASSPNKEVNQYRNNGNAANNTNKINRHPVVRWLDW